MELTNSELVTKKEYFVLEEKLLEAVVDREVWK